MTLSLRVEEFGQHLLEVPQSSGSQCQERVPDRRNTGAAGGGGWFWELDVLHVLSPGGFGFVTEDTEEPPPETETGGHRRGTFLKKGGEWGRGREEVQSQTVTAVVLYEGGPALPP